MDDWKTAFQEVMAATWDPLLIVTCADQKVVDANSAASRLYGIAVQNLVGSNFAELFSEHRFLADIFATHRDYVPLRFQRVSRGRHFPVEMSLRYFRDGDVEYAAIAIRDISERQSRQREENESERKYQSLFEASPYPILMLTTHGTIVDANRCALVCYGYEHEELAGQEWGMLESSLPAYSFLARPSVLPPCEHRRKDGSGFMAEVVLSYFRLHNQPMVLALIRDITEHWRTFQQLQESEARWRFAIEGHGDALIDWPLQDQGQYYLSPNLSRMLGYDDRDGGLFEVQAWRAWAHPDDLRGLDNAIARHIKGQTDLVQLEFRLLAKDGAYRWVALRAKIIEISQSNRRLIGAIRDIHELHQRKLQEAEDREKLFRLERLATVGEMLSVLAHEVNQPLTAIANYSSIGIHQLASRRRKDDVRKTLGVINFQALRAGEIVRRIRNFVRRSEPEYAPADVNQLIGRVAGWAERQASAVGIAINLELDKDLPEVELDLLQIEQVVFNLLRNGVEAMRDELQCQPRQIIVSSRRRDDVVEVAVRDHGEGLPESASLTIFDPFVSTKPEGMGMGLAVCRTVIENHQGSLWFEQPEDGRGTRFVFTLNLNRPRNMELFEAANECHA